MSDTADALARRDNLERRLVTIWAAVLRRDDIGTRTRFDELGGDSLKGLRLLSKVGKEFHIRMPASAFLDYPTVAQMADYLEDLLDQGEFQKG